MRLLTIQCRIVMPVYLAQDLSVEEGAADPEADFGAEDLRSVEGLADVVEAASVAVDLAEGPAEAGNSPAICMLTILVRRPKWAAS